MYLWLATAFKRCKVQIESDIEVAAIPGFYAFISAKLSIYVSKIISKGARIIEPDIRMTVIPLVLQRLTPVALSVHNITLQAFFVNIFLDFN